MESYRDRLKRDQRQKRLKDILWLLALFVLAGAVVGGWRYVQRPEFSFGKIAVHGSSNFSVGQLAQMGGEKEPVNLFRFSKTDMLTALRGDVRVEKAEAYYNFPNVLNVYINERQPALYVKTSYRNYAKLDADGLVLDLTDGIKDASVPRLSGKDCGNLFIGDRLQDQDIRDVLLFFQKLKYIFFIQLKIHFLIFPVKASHDLTIYWCIGNGKVRGFINLFQIFHCTVSFLKFMFTAPLMENYIL